MVCGQLSCHQEQCKDPRLPLAIYVHQIYVHQPELHKEGHRLWHQRPNQHNITLNENIRSRKITAIINLCNLRVPIND